MNALFFRIATASLAALTLSSCVYWTPISRRTSNAATVIPNVPMQVWDIKSCGAGSLSSLLQHHGDTTTMKEWEAVLPKTRGGVMSIDLVLAARQKGFDSRLITGDEMTIERELLDGRPLILMLQVIQAPGRGYDFFHYVVLDGYDPKRNLFRTQFGDGKARWVKFKRIELAWKRAGYAAILVREKDPATDALRAAVALEEKGLYADAAREYRAIINQHPTSVLAWTNLGNAEMQNQNPNAAEQAFRKAISLDESSADALNNLAWLLYQQKRLEEAEALAKRAVATPAPDPWMRLDTLARIQMERGACGEAVKTWDKAIEEVPQTRTSERAELQREAARARGNCRT